MRFLYQRKDNKHRIKKHPGSPMTIIPSCIGTDTSSLVCDFTMLLYLERSTVVLTGIGGNNRFHISAMLRIHIRHAEREYTWTRAYLLRWPCFMLVMHTRSVFGVLHFTLDATLHYVDFLKWGYPRSMSRACGSTERGMESCPRAVSKTRRIGLVALP